MPVAQPENTLLSFDLALQQSADVLETDLRFSRIAAESLSEGTCAMKVRYDKETDTLVITLHEEQIRESDEVRPGVIADFGEDGGIVRLEILRASKVVEKYN